MTLTRRSFAFAMLGAGSLLAAAAAAAHVRAQPSAEPGAAQDQPPHRREFTIRARDYRFIPNRIEVTQDDLVKLTIQSEDVAYSLTIDEYRVSKRVPPGGSTTLEFRADRAGTFSYYSNLTSDDRHARMRGDLVVAAR